MSIQKFCFQFLVILITFSFFIKWEKVTFPVYRLQPLENPTVERILWGSVCRSSGSSRPLPLDVQLTVVQDRSHRFLCCSPRRGGALIRPNLLTVKIVNALRYVSLFAGGLCGLRLWEQTPRPHSFSSRLHESRSPALTLYLHFRKNWKWPRPPLFYT